MSDDRLEEPALTLIGFLETLQDAGLTMPESVRRAMAALSKAMEEEDEDDDAEAAK